MATSIETPAAIESIGVGSIAPRSISNPIVSQSNTEIIDVGPISARQINNFFLISGDGDETIDAGLIKPRTLFIELFGAANIEIVDIKLALANYEMLSQCLLTIDLEPGEELIIDAENYTVTKDGIDATGSHSGQWIDEIDRDTDVISIQNGSGSSDYTAEIFYTERYR